MSLDITLFSNTKVKQIAWMYSGMAISVFLGIANSVLSARLLGPQQFGDFKYVSNVFMLLSSLSQAGIYVTGSRLLAIETSDEVKKMLTGALILTSLVLSFTLALISLLFGLIQTHLNQSNLSVYFFLFAPLLFGYQLINLFTNKFMGENRIKQLSLLQFLPQTFFLVVFVLLSLVLTVKTNTALFVQLFGFCIVGLLFIFIERKKFDFQNIKYDIQFLLRENKKFGAQVYIGSVFNVSSQYLSAVFLSIYNTNNINVGYFTLAVTISAPLTILASSIGSVYYKEFSISNNVPERVIYLSVIFSLIVYVIYFITIKYIVTIFYSEQYLKVAELAIFLAIGSIIHGFGDLFNRFLGSKGEGKLLRNAAVFTGIVIIFGNAILIKHLNINGALITRILSDITYFGFTFFYYRLIIK